MFHWSYVLFLFIYCGLYVTEGITLQLLTENVIKDRPITLFCNIPNFTNLAELVMPDRFPIRYLLCNNRNGCSINKNKLFDLKSNSSGLILTLKNVSETMEGKYECIYKGRKVTYLLDNLTMDIIDPKNGCQIIRSENVYKCQTKYVMLKENLVHWEFKTVDKIITWRTSAKSRNHSCSNKKVQYDSHMEKGDIGHLSGTLRCYVTLSEGLNITSPSIRVLVSDKDKQETTSINVPLIVVIIVVVAIPILVIIIGIIIWQIKRKMPTRGKQNEEHLCTCGSLHQK